MKTSISYAGAKYISKLFSIIQTCKLNNINAEKYLNYVLANIDKIDVQNLLPYSKNIKDKFGGNWRIKKTVASVY